MESQFEMNLDKLRTRIIKMSSLVDEQVSLALKAFDEEDLELAETVIDRDKKVNKFDRRIEKTCQKIIALNQPVAMDLRLIMSAFTINSNLERIGDLAKSVCSSFLELKSKPDFLERTRHYEMAAKVKEIIRDSIDSFNNSDAQLARKVLETDLILDSLFSENRQILIEYMSNNSDKIEQAVVLLEISRQFERLGDHAKNIAEDVIFIVEAQLIRHKYEKYLIDSFGEEEEDEGFDEDESREE